MNADQEVTKVVSCQACGAPNAADALVCASCGATLPTATVVPVMDTVETPPPAALVAPATTMIDAPAFATPTQPERGGCLTAWLSLSMIFGVLAIPSVIGLFVVTQLNASIVFTALEGVAYGIAALAIWKWKKWGVYLYVVTAVLGLALRTISGPEDMGPVQTGLEFSAFGFLVSMFILYSLVKPKWQYLT